MQKRPGGAAERFDVGGAVGGRLMGIGGRCGGCGGGCGWATGGGVFFYHGGPGGDGGTGAAARAAVRSPHPLVYLLVAWGPAETHGLPSLPRTTPLGRAFSSGAAGSSDSVVCFLSFFCTSLKNLSMLLPLSGRRKLPLTTLDSSSLPAKLRHLVSAKRNNAMPSMPLFDLTSTWL